MYNNSFIVASMKTGERIKSRRNTLGLTLEDLSVACGWKSGPSGAMRMWNYERGRDVRPDDIKKIALALKTTPQWLLFGIGSADFSIKNLPLLPMEDVEKWMSGTIEQLEGIAMTVTIVSNEFKITEKAFFVDIEGDSMVSVYNLADSYLQGDRALVEPGMDAKNGDTVLLAHKDCIKIRQLLKDGTENILKAFNPQYPILKLTADIKIIGVILATQRNRVQKTSR